MDVTKSRTADPSRIRADVVVIPVADPPGTPAGPLAQVDSALGGLVSAVIKDGEVTGKAGQVRVLHSRGDIPAKRVLLVGVGADPDRAAARWPAPDGGALDAVAANHLARSGRFRAAAALAAEAGLGDGAALVAPYVETQAVLAQAREKGVEGGHSSGVGGGRLGVLPTPHPTTTHQPNPPDAGRESGARSGLGGRPPGRPGHRTWAGRGRCI